MQLLPGRVSSSSTQKRQEGRDGASDRDSDGDNDNKAGK